MGWGQGVEGGNSEGPGSPEGLGMTGCDNVGNDGHTTTATTGSPRPPKPQGQKKTPQPPFSPPHLSPMSNDTSNPIISISR